MGESFNTMLRVPTWHKDIAYPQVFIPYLAEEKESKPSVHDEEHPNTLFTTCTIWAFSAAWTSRPTGFIRKHRGGLNNWKWNTSHVTRFLQKPFRHSLGVEVDKGTSRMTAMSVSEDGCYRILSILLIIITRGFYISTDSNWRDDTFKVLSLMLKHGNITFTVKQWVWKKK